MMVLFILIPPFQSAAEGAMLQYNKPTSGLDPDTGTGSEASPSFSPFTPSVRMSGTDVRAKEVILVCLALALLIFSVSLFFKHWRKNYWDINQLPYYAYLYKVSRYFRFKIYQS